MKVTPTAFIFCISVACAYGWWGTDEISECSSAVRNAAGSPKCVYVNAWDPEVWRKRDQPFALSKDGRRHWKMEKMEFTSLSECVNYEFTPLHEDDFIIKSCGFGAMNARIFYRWYFLTDAWERDDRFEAQRLHGSEMDCSLSKVQLTNALTGIFRGQRDNRLCPFSLLEDNRRNQYASNIMIAPTNPSMYYAMLIHGILGFSGFAFCLLLLLRYRKDPNIDIFNSLEVRIMTYIFRCWLVELLFVLWSFYREPFLSSYSLSKDTFRLDGGLLNAFTFLHVPLKINFFLFPGISNDSKATFLRNYLKFACYFAVPLLQGILFVQKIRSKYMWDPIVGCMCVFGSVPFYLKMYQDINIKAEEFDSQQSFLETLYAMSFGVCHFLLTVFLGVANNIPLFRPSWCWYYTLIPVFVNLKLHQKFVLPLPMASKKCD